MSPPVVFIKRRSLYNMIMAANETYGRECFGYIFGSKPTRGRNSFIIDSALAVQLAQKRKGSEIVQSGPSRDRMVDFFKRYPLIYPLLGDFHSHPDFSAHHKTTADFSEGDIIDMKKQENFLGFLIGVVIHIAPVKKERVLWQSVDNAGIKGSLGRCKFHINVCRVIKDEDGNDISEILRIKADPVLKSLNRALGYA